MMRIEMDLIRDANENWKKEYDILSKKLSIAIEALIDLQKIEYLGMIGRSRAKLALDEIKALDEPSTSPD